MLVNRTESIAIRPRNPTTELLTCQELVLIQYIGDTATAVVGTDGNDFIACSSADEIHVIKSGKGDDLIVVVSEVGVVVDGTVECRR